MVGIIVSCGVQSRMVNCTDMYMDGGRYNEIEDDQWRSDIQFYWTYCRWSVFHSCLSSLV